MAVIFFILLSCYRKGTLMTYGKFFGLAGAGLLALLAWTTSGYGQDAKKLNENEALIAPAAAASSAPFNGLDMNLGNLYRLSNAKSRSISPENFTGEKGKAAMSTDGPAKGAARELGQGW